MHQSYMGHFVLIFTLVFELECTQNFVTYQLIKLPIVNARLDLKIFKNFKTSKCRLSKAAPTRSFWLSVRLNQSDCQSPLLFMWLKLWFQNIWKSVILVHQSISSLNGMSIHRVSSVSSDSDFSLDKKRIKISRPKNNEVFSPSSSQCTAADSIE